MSPLWSFLPVVPDFWSDWLDFMPDDASPDPVASRFCVAAELPEPDDGALCWAEEPDCPCWPIPPPCAWANPAPAISAAAATEIIKRLVIECLLTSVGIARADNERTGEGFPSRTGSTRFVF